MFGYCSICKNDRTGQSIWICNKCREATINNDKAQKLLLEIKPAIREIFWISQCWNDHNFSEKDLLEKCRKVSKIILGDNLKHRDVDKANEWLSRIDHCTKD